MAEVCAKRTAILFTFSPISLIICCLYSAIMYRFSFKIRHRGCSETGLSMQFPKHTITVIDIQSLNPKEKQYLYHITGNAADFDAILDYLHNAPAYKMAKEIERKRDSLVVLVVLHQLGYIQNAIQKHHGFFIDLHTVSGGYEYWHVGVINRDAIKRMKEEIATMGEMQVLYIGEADFSQPLLSPQQKKIFSFALESGYYEVPRKTTIAKLAKLLKLNSATVGEHLMRAENTLMKAMGKRI